MPAIVRKTTAVATATTMPRRSARSSVSLRQAASTGGPAQSPATERNAAPAATDPTTTASTPTRTANRRRDEPLKADVVARPYVFSNGLVGSRIRTSTGAASLLNLSASEGVPTPSTKP